jgi:hypothetical protein
MSNASRCQTIADRYAKLAAAAKEPDVRRAYENLHRLWLAMAPPAERFDRQSDGEAKARIYAMIDAVEDARRQVA